MKSLILCLPFLLVGVAPAIAAQSLLHPMFQDHAVLQRDKPIRIYGFAAPGTVVSVKLGEASTNAAADARGNWLITLPSMAAGGPYSLHAHAADGADQVANDILVGDVFLCSGQSNMQLAVRWANWAQWEMQIANDGLIRSLTVETQASVSPLQSFAAPVAWSVASPQTVGDFSASCFYFARELRKSIGVPIGIVVAAWGGSRVRDWISEEGLRPLHYFDADLHMLSQYRRDPQSAQQMWSRTSERWWREHSAAATKPDPWQPEYPIDDWKTVPATLGPWALWESANPDGFTGQVWLRTTVTLAAKQARQGAVLDLGVVNEDEQSWINGKGVGGTSWSHKAEHIVPASVLKPGENVIVTNVFCSWRNCGLSGAIETRALRFRDGSAVPLDQPWRYKQVGNGVIAPQLPWAPTHGLAQTYNGMIAPIGAYGFRAVAWYQGESDIYFAENYQTSMAALMVDWRRRFGAELPFLIVQLPAYGPRPTEPTASLWSDVREAQRRAARADSHAANIVTLDIGEPENLHPGNKQEIGRRLANGALRVVYGDTGAATGAVPRNVSRIGRTIEVSFDNVTGSLVAYSGSPNGFEPCGSTQASCRYIGARIVDKNKLQLLDEAGESAERVRFCWGDSPYCSLSDFSKLPVTPFEMPIQ